VVDPSWPPASWKNPTAIPAPLDRIDGAGAGVGGSVPDKHDAILSVARNIGWHRVEIGRHYLTDIYAGRVMAQAIVREMKASPDFSEISRSQGRNRRGPEVNCAGVRPRLVTES